MAILFLGAGGTGGYFGGRLAQAGKDVVFLVRPGRQAQLARDGLRITSPFGDAQVAVRAVQRADEAGPAQLVVLTCKAYDLDSAMDAIAPAMGRDTLVLPLLNGLRHLDSLDARFGPERVLGGFCHLATTLAPDGSIHHMNRVHRLSLGARTPAQQAVAQRAYETLAGAGFDLALCTDVRREMWEKYVFLATLAAMTCLLRASVGEICATRHGRGLMLEAFAACQAVARAEGAELSEQWRRQTEGFLTDPASTLTASMLRDLEKGGRTEAEHVLGDMLERAAAHGLRLPLLEAAYAQLQAHERRIAGR
ncbi:MAG: 2-dehydropantoate 2-reductase [Pseudomonadota bacterium]